MVTAQGGSSALRNESFADKGWWQGPLLQCLHLLNFVSVNKPVTRSCRWVGTYSGIKKLAYFSGMLSVHCKICLVFPEAQAVQGAQCSYQNLQNQTYSTVSCYHNRLCCSVDRG